MKNTFFLITILLLVSCKTAKTQEVSTSNLCRLRLTFGSIGSGINTNAYKQFQQFVGNYEKKKGKKLEYETVHWGMEGETDYCFRLSDLKLKEQKKFVADMKKAISDHKWIFFTENVELRQVPNRAKKQLIPEGKTD